MDTSQMNDNIYIIFCSKLKCGDQELSVGVRKSEMRCSISEDGMEMCTGELGGYSDFVEEHAFYFSDKMLITSVHVFIYISMIA